MAKKFSIPANKVTALLTASDVFTWGAYYIIATLTSIYLAGKLEGNIVQFVGIGNAVYFIVRGVVQVPFGLIADKFKQDRDEIWLLAVGNVLMGLPFVFFPLIESLEAYLVLQAIFGVGTALNLVNWRKLFSQNIDPNREGAQYAFYDTIISLSSAALGVAGGLIAGLSTQNFDFVMFSFGAIMILSAIFPLVISFIKTRRSNGSSLTNVANSLEDLRVMK